MDCLCDAETTGGLPVYSPVYVRTREHRRPVPPTAFDCVRLVLVRRGTAVVCSEFGQEPARPGDVIVVCPGVLCSGLPEGSVLVSTVFVDTDYLADLMFWKHAAWLSDRQAARTLGERRYRFSAVHLRFRGGAADRLDRDVEQMDELAGHGQAMFYELQALLSDVLHVVVPLLPSSPVRLSGTGRARLHPAPPRHREYLPLRPEVMAVDECLRRDLAHHWSAQEIASVVHLSTRQLSRVFVASFGKTPLTYLTLLRVEEMARLLRECGLTPGVAATRVGWRSRAHASDMFRRSVGVSPGDYQSQASGRNLDVAGRESDASGP